MIRPLMEIAGRHSARQQRRSALWDPALWSGTVSGDGRLVLDGVDLAALADTHGSPLMAVSRARLRADASSFLSAVETSLPDATVAFSYKTNCIPGVLRELHSLGFCAEVISPYELWLAHRLGVPATQIVVNGVNKGYEYLHEAARLGVAAVNVDELSELPDLERAARRLGRRVRIGLRLRVDRDSHFGLCLESGAAMAAARRLVAAPDLFEFAGLHFHAVADNDDPERHIRFMREALDFARQLRDTLGLVTPALNIGGGYTVPTMKVMSRWEYARQRLLGVPGRPPDPANHTDARTYFTRIAAALQDWCAARGLARPRLVLEPGRIVTSRSHVLLTRVHSIKANARGPDFAMTDAGRILTSYPCDYEYHQIFAANRMGAPPDARYQLMGRLCTSADWLAKNRCLPRLAAGDVLAIMDAGAYFSSYASNFAFPRPAIVLLDDGHVEVLRHRETFEHLTGMDVDGALRAAGALAV